MSPLPRRHRPNHHWLCAGSGGAKLENNIKKILRKVAVKIVKEEEKNEKKKKPTVRKKVTTYKITEENLKEYLGKPIFTSDRFYDKTPVGVCMGLAWTSYGGATLYVEAIS